MTATDVLAQHLDSPEQRHRLTLLDSHRLRCHDCHRTLVLPTGNASVGPTSTSRIHPRAHEQCPQHIGEFATSCGRCRADAIAVEHPRPPAPPTADVAAGIAACRNALRRQEQDA